MKNELKVLVIEDDYRYAHELVVSLQLIVPDVNLNAHIVHTASEVIQASLQSYDVVFIDLYLSRHDHRISGHSILEALNQASPSTKFVLYTSFLPSSTEEQFQGGFLSDIRGADFIFKSPRAIDLFDDRLPSILKDFIPDPTKLRHEPQTSLILPVKKTLTIINDRLTDIFRNDPEMLRKIDPILFEKFVAELFEEEGYEIVLTPARVDGGKDIYVYKTDPATQAMFVVECKRYVLPNKVDVSIARQLYGVVQQEQASGGIIVTTSYFTKPAKEFAETIPYQLFLRDFDDLVQWLRERK